MEERYSVTTPENVSIGYDVAGIGSRFIAALIDIAIYGVIAIAFGLVASRIIAGLDDPTAAAMVGAAYIGLSFLMYWGYYILFELVWGGQSPGKRLVKLRVVRLDGTPAGPGQIVIRNVARLVDIFPGFYAVGLITMLFNDQSRRLGDLAAGTLVVREARNLTLQQLAQMPSAHYSLSDKAAEEARALPMHLLSKDQRLLASEFIQRRESMSDAQRARLALQIAQSVALQMNLLSPSHPSQAEYLLELVSGSQA